MRRMATDSSIQVRPRRSTAVRLELVAFTTEPISVTRAGQAGNGGLHLCSELCRRNTAADQHDLARRLRRLRRDVARVGDDERVLRCGRKLANDSDEMERRDVILMVFRILQAKVDELADAQLKVVHRFLRQEYAIRMRGNRMQRQLRIIVREERVRQVGGITDGQRIDAVDVLKIISHIRETADHRSRSAHSRNEADAIEQRTGWIRRRPGDRHVRAVRQLRLDAGLRVVRCVEDGSGRGKRIRERPRDYAARDQPCLTCAIQGTACRRESSIGRQHRADLPRRSRNTHTFHTELCSAAKVPGVQL